MAQSRLAEVWKKLQDSTIDEDLINEFQEWAQEEEFDYDALIDDINDKEDESSISQWLKDNNYNKNDEFNEIQKVITPHGFNKNKKTNNKKYEIDVEDDIKYDDNNNDNDKNPEWVGLPRQVTITINKNEKSEDADSSLPSLLLNNMDPSNPNISDLLVTLNSHLDFNSNPSVVQDLIHQLQQYNIENKDENGDIFNSKSTPNGTSTAGGDGMIIGIESSPKVSGDDLLSIKSALNRLNEYKQDELNEFVRFCKDEEYGEDQLIDDIEVFEEGDSAIIENIASMFDWNSGKAVKFVNNLRNILGLNVTHKRTSSYNVLNNPSMISNKITPNGDDIDNKMNKMSIIKEKKETDSVDSKIEFTSSEIDNLPKIDEFLIPISIMKRKVGRSMDDIEDCFRQNGISSSITDAIRDFCEEEKCDEFNYSDLKNGIKLKQRYGSIGSLLSEYILKCQYELKIPLFKASTFSKSDETAYSQYMELECPGIIKHDRDLLRYFLLTKETEPDLSSLLIDIVDRISVNDEYPLDLKTFTNKSFFNKLNKSQISIIKNGLRTYHNRFFPRLTMNPLSLICDKISDFQKYSCILSEFIKQIIDKKIILEPALIDFMIIPPGVFNKINNNFTAEKVIDLGDIKRHLNDFDNYSYSIFNDGLSAENDNFNQEIINKIVNNLCEGIKKIISNCKTNQYQRYAIIIDRRWRIINNKHCLYNKLRSVHSTEIYDHKIINKDAFDYKEYEKDNGLTHDTGFEECDINGYDDDDDDDDDQQNQSGGLFGGQSKIINFKHDAYKTFIDEENIKNDIYYIFQPKAPYKSRKVNEFSSTFCHETLMCLTKQCILPRKKQTIAEFKNATNPSSSSYGSSSATKNNANKMIMDEDDDEFSALTHLSGDSADGYMFNLSVHLYKPYPNNIWYKYKLKWYLFTQSASIRISQNDLNKFWFKYFVDPEKDIHKLSDKKIKKYFKFDLNESDVGFKRWYHAIKRTMH